MSYTTEDIQSPIPSVQIQSPAQMPTKEFIGYDPNGTTTITGTPNERAGVNVKQPEISKEGEAPAEEEKSVTLSPKVSAIARREQAQRQREAQLKQREQALAAKLADAEKFAAIKAKLANKDYSAAEELGLTYEEYTNHLVTRQAEKNPLEEKQRELDRKIEELKKAQEETIQRDYQVNQNLWRQEISRVVSAGDEFSTIKELGAEDMVLAHINDSFEEDNVELSAEQAAKEIEAALLERAEKFASLSKIKQKFEVPKRLGPPNVPKTITQNMTVSSQKPVKKPFHLMSESEQLAQAYRRVQEAKMQR